jgi:hypothetical protein
MTNSRIRIWTAIVGIVATLGCGSSRSYQNKNMDFGSIRTVVVMPFWNMSREQLAADRVRDVFSTMLLATEAVYVVPTGETARAISRAGVANQVTPSTEEIVKVGSLLKAEALITGVVKEYGEVRGGSSAANVVSVSAQMFETTTGKLVWSGTSTKGGVSFGARLLGTAGGDPVNDVTEQAVDDLLKQLLR